MVVTTMENKTYDFESFNIVSLEDGIKIDGAKVKGIQEIEIKSDVTDVSQITIKFLAKVKDLDFLSNNRR